MRLKCDVDVGKEGLPPVKSLCRCLYDCPIDLDLIWVFCVCRVPSLMGGIVSPQKKKDQPQTPQHETVSDSKLEEPDNTATQQQQQEEDYPVPPTPSPTASPGPSPVSPYRTPMTTAAKSTEPTLDVLRAECVTPGDFRELYDVKQVLGR